MYALHYIVPRYATTTTTTTTTATAIALGYIILYMYNNISYAICPDCCCGCPKWGGGDRRDKKK